MEKVTSKIGECRGLRSKFERDKKDLSAALVKTGTALGWDVDQVRNPKNTFFSVLWFQLAAMSSFYAFG